MVHFGFMAEKQVFFVAISNKDKQKGPTLCEAFFLVARSGTSFEHLESLFNIFDLIMNDENT